MTLGRDTASGYPGLSRRDFLAGSAALGGLALLAGSGGATEVRAAPAGRARAETGTRLVLLGTASGPPEMPGRSQPSQVILVDGVPYVVDYGNGVARQLVAAGVPLPSLRYLFLTHHHSDHNADYAPLLLRAWVLGMKRLDSFGPPPLAELNDLVLRAYEAEIASRIWNLGHAPLTSAVEVHEIAEAGLVHEDERVRVTATTVVHPPVEPSLAYRFDTADRSIVISGDTAWSENLIELAQGADVLVHEVYHPSVLPGFLNDPRGPEVGRRLQEHFVISHTTPEEVGKIASTAGVKTVVLTHFARSGQIGEQTWLEAVAATFDGEVVVGKDLLVI